MKKYQIKEMAMLLDVSPSALRNFEEKGLLFPQRTQSGGYRQYDPVDLNLLFRIRGFTRCGFSLEKTAKLMHEMNLESISDAYKEQSAEVEKEIALLMLKQRYMDHRSAHLRRAARMGNAWILDESPAMYILPFRTEDEILEEGGRGELIRQWAAMKPLTESLLLFPFSGLLDGSLDFVCGTCIEKEYGDALGICAQGHIRLMEAQPLCAYFLVPTRFLRKRDTTVRKNVWNYMQNVLAQLNAAGYVPAGDGYGTTLHTRISSDEYYSMSELWVPLQKMQIDS